MGGSCGTIGKKKIEYAVLGAKYEGKRPVGRPWRRWEDIEKYRTSICWGGVDWIYLAIVRERWRDVVIMVMNIWVP